MVVSQEFEKNALSVIRVIAVVVLTWLVFSVNSVVDRLDKQEVVIEDVRKEVKEARVDVKAGQKQVVVTPNLKGIEDRLDRIENRRLFSRNRK